jgi:hypothetical protein
MTDLGDAIIIAAVILALAWIVRQLFADFSSWARMVAKFDHEKDPDLPMRQLRDFAEEAGFVKPKVRIDQDREGDHPFGGR